MIPSNVPVAPLDNVSFHPEKSAKKWRCVYQRRIARERELHEDALKCKEIIELIKEAWLLKTVSNIERCCNRLVKEFVVNVSLEVVVKGHEDFKKVFVRGKCVKFSST